jgi:hypothetical protein
MSMSNKQAEFVGFLILAAGGYGLYKGYEWLQKPSINVTSLGLIRLVSCNYQGDFMGGYGYDCVVHNYASDLRQPQMTCASFDEASRLIGSPDEVGDLALSHAALSPGEERVVRVYFNEKAKQGVCSETGDIPNLSELQRDPQYKSSGMYSELQL